MAMHGPSTGVKNMLWLLERESSSRRTSAWWVVLAGALCRRRIQKLPPKNGPASVACAARGRRCLSRFYCVLCLLRLHTAHAHFMLTCSAIPLSTRNMLQLRFGKCVPNSYKRDKFHGTIAFTQASTAATTTRPVGQTYPAQLVDSWNLKTAP